MARGIGIAIATRLRGRRFATADPACGHWSSYGAVRGALRLFRALTRWCWGCPPRLSEIPQPVLASTFSNTSNVGGDRLVSRPRKLGRVLCSGPTRGAAARLLYSNGSSNLLSRERVIPISHASCDFPAINWCHVTGGSQRIRRCRLS